MTAPNKPPTLTIHGHVKSVDDAGFVLTIGTQEWPIAWPDMRSIKIPTVGEYIACLTEVRGAPGVMTFEAVNWFKARLPRRVR